MSATRFAEGNYVDYTPPADVSAGDVVALGSTGLVGVAEVDIEANKKGALAISGVFKVSKDTTSDVIAIGDLVDLTNDPGFAVVDSVVSSSHIAAGASAATDTNVLVAINVGPIVTAVT